MDNLQWLKKYQKIYVPFELLVNIAGKAPRTFYMRYIAYIFLYFIKDFICKTAGGKFRGLKRLKVPWPEYHIPRNPSLATHQDKQGTRPSITFPKKKKSNSSLLLWLLAQVGTAILPVTAVKLSLNISGNKWATFSGF
jgi:hypothetical protein